MTESVASLPMPTIISNSVMLNSVIHGAERAAEILGEGHFAITQKGFLKTSVSVFRDSQRAPSDLLNLDNPMVEPSPAIWEMELKDFTVYTSDPGSFFKANPPRYFFLTEKEALAHLEEIEQKIITAVLAAAEAVAKKEGES